MASSISFFSFRRLFPKQWARLVAGTLLSLAIVTGNVRAATPCETIIAQAYQRLNTSCNDLSRNQACFGNDSIRAEFQAPFDPRIFRKVGDKAPVSELRELVTLPMDIQANTWGLSLLKVQTNLPDTAPGQNVVFLLSGDVRLSNADTTGRMSAFYFTSGLGQPMCKAAPADGLLIRSPKGTRIQFTANGVNIDIGSTVALKAESNKQLTVELLEGSANISAGGTMRSLKPGQMLSVPLGGVDGLQPIGIPSMPVAAPVSPAQVGFIEQATVALTTSAPGITNPPPAQLVPPASVTPPTRIAPPKNNGNGNGKNKGDDDDDDDDKKEKKDDKSDQKDKDDKKNGGKGK